MIFAIIVIVVVVLIIIYVVASYNGLVRLNQQASEAWSDITVQLKRRYDLIPNLVNTVQGYATHEKSIFEDVAKARSAALSATSVADTAKAENQFQQTMKSLFAVAENYPDLKASQNFQELQAELTDTEDKIQASRRFYNGVVRDFNTKRKTFPTNIFAKRLGFNQDKEYFEVDESQNAVIQEPVAVKF
ncbi:MAG TPA: LemA family protein [Candidatus Saccharimonadales bacterium]|nr:LemA family protein [Candidatus Saccharimonadales bacterium]